MNSKERLTALLTGDIPDRIGKADAPWPETRKLWYEQGLPADVHANDHFNMDIRRMIKMDTSFRLPESVEEETDEYRIVRTTEGNLEKYWKGTGVPQTLEYALKDANDWQRLKERLTPSTDRIAIGYYGDYAYEYVSAPYDKVQRAWDAFPEKDNVFVKNYMDFHATGFSIRVSVGNLASRCEEELKKKREAK